MNAYEMNTLTISLIIIGAYILGAFVIGLPFGKLTHRLYWKEGKAGLLEKLLFPGWVFLHDAHGGSPRGSWEYSQTRLVHRAPPGDRGGLRTYLGSWFLTWLPRLLIIVCGAILILPTVAICALVRAFGRAARGFVYFVGACVTR